MIMCMVVKNKMLDGKKIIPHSNYHCDIFGYTTIYSIRWNPFKI